jgi:uncharacterized membrane-anchored protein
MSVRLLPRRRAGRIPAASEIVATARLGPRTKDLAKEIERGHVAIIDHRDIDRVAGESLVAAGVAAVVNGSPSISGRYPNGGPKRIVAMISGVTSMSGIPASTIRDGDTVVVDGSEIRRTDGTVVAVGTRWTPASIDVAMEAAREGVGDELRRFAANTLNYVDAEAELAFAPLPLPQLRTQIRGRHAMVVVRGHDYKEDLKALRAYIKEFRPVLIAVDGGADALLDIGLTPDIIFGDFDSLSTYAMHCGAELVAHAHPDGRSPASEVLDAAGLEHHIVPAAGMSEDIAMLLAYEAGAPLIVAVGTHATMVEFLDKGRRGMASTFLTRLRLGPVLVDAKGVNRLYQTSVRRTDILMLVLAALVAIGVAILAFESLQTFLEGLRLWWEDAWRQVRQWFG